MTRYKKKYVAFMFALMGGLPISAQGVWGTWNGQLNVGSGLLNIVFHVGKDKTVTMDSPDQGAYKIPTEVKFLSADSIQVEVPKLKIQYTGKLTRNTIEGVFSQAGYSFPLDLKPGDVKWNRPQNPQPPFGYQTEEVSFYNPGLMPSGKKTTGGPATLSGTLTYPVNYKKGCPVVILISGSGQQNRDEEVMGHKPFLVIADYLAKHGVASLRYDDRGVGKSTGDASLLNSHDEMLDAQAGIEYLRGTKKFGKVGVIGHSEGGTIGYMLAARKLADFVVSMAGPALPGDSILILQNRDILAASGCDATIINNYSLALRKILNYKKGRFETLRKGNGAKLISADNETMFAVLMMGIHLPDAMKLNLKEVYKLKSRWMDYWIAYNPASDIRKIICPVMAIGGSKDLQVNASANLKATSQLLPSATIKQYDGLNHLFQPCITGMVTEYSAISTTISEEVMRDMAEWITGLK